MSFADIAPFLLAAFLMEITPGPNMGYLATLALQYGRAAGFRAVAGVTAGLGLYLIASVFGGMRLIAENRWAYEMLRWGGVAFMLWLAWDAWRGAGDAAVADVDPQSPFLRGFIANALNPKAALLYVTLLPNFIRVGRTPIWTQTLWLGGAHLMISVAVHTLIVIAAARASAFALNPDSRASARMLARGAAAAMAGIAVWLAWETRA